MSATVPTAGRSREVRSYEGIRPNAAKAGLKKSEAVGRGPAESEFGHGPMIWDSLVRGHGSVKATAITMGGKDESQIRRQVTEGTIRLREFFEADHTALCEFAEYVLETFQPARKSPRQLARERLPELIAVVMSGLEDE